MAIAQRARKAALRALRRGSSPTPGLRETIGIIERYVVQETLGPLRSLWRTLAFGLAGAMVSGFGALITMLGILRLLQTETGGAFAGSWSFAPYLLTALTGAALLGGLVLAGLRALHVIRGSA